MNWTFFRVRDIWSGNLSRFSPKQTLLPVHNWYTRVWNRWTSFLPKTEGMNWIPFRDKNIWSGNLSRFSETQTLLSTHRAILEFETGELGFYESLREVNRILFSLGYIESGGIHQDSVRDIHYYQLTMCILKSEIVELGFYQSLRAMNRILFRVRCICRGNLSRFSWKQTLLLAHKWYSWVWNRWIWFLPKSERHESDFFSFRDIWRGNLSRFGQTSHYYRLTSGIIESERDEIDFYQSLWEMNWILFRVRFLWSENLSILNQSQTLLLDHKGYTKVWIRWIRFLPKSESDEFDSCLG